MIKKGDHQAPARSLLHATGALKSPTDMNKPFVAICNSYIDIVPGHVHLRELADIAKVLGLALPYNGTALAVSDQRRKMIRQAAFQLVENIKNDIKPRDIVTKEAIDDAFALDMAMGGSTNTVLHTLAIANEAGIEYDLERINEIAKKTPY